MDRMNTGLAPGVVAVIDSVSDDASRALFRMLIQERQEQKSMDAARHDQVVSLLSDVSVGLSNAKADIAAIKCRMDGPALCPLSCSEDINCRNGFPSLIHARTASNSTASSQSAGSKRSSSSHVSDGPLHCPFCPSRHDSEKVHVQHMDRILDQ